jgi:hypothetical protein
VLVCDDSERPEEQRRVAAFCDQHRERCVLVRTCSP